MYTQFKRKQYQAHAEKGVTLIELIVFIVVISVALGALISVFSKSVGRSVDPVINIRLLEIAQSKLDLISARRYDEATPSGGVPACGSAETAAAACIAATTFGIDTGEVLTDVTTLDDVDDFNTFTETDADGYTSTVAVSFSGGDLGLAANHVKKITVTVTHSSVSQNFKLSTYRTNF